MNYVEYIDSQIKRLKNIEKYENKMNASKKDSKKEYYLAGMKMLLSSGETLDNYKIYYMSMKMLLLFVKRELMIYTMKLKLLKIKIRS